MMLKKTKFCKNTDQYRLAAEKLNVNIAKLNFKSTKKY